MGLQLHCPIYGCGQLQANTQVRTYKYKNTSNAGVLQTLKDLPVTTFIWDSSSTRTDVPLTSITRPR